MADKISQRALFKSFNNIVDWFALTNSGGEKLGKHRRDYLSQIRSYRASLESGFKVITVAHSQGNLFTLEVFQTLQEEGYTDDIYAISVASPSAHPIMIGTPRVDWDNDLVSSLKGIALEHYPNKPLHCIVRYVDWDDINILKSRPKPISHYVYEKNKGTVINGKWQLNEPMYIYEINSQVHAFTFYMGLPLRLDLPKKNSDGTTVTKPILDAYDGSKLIDTKAKEKILDYIKFQLDKNMQDGQGDTNNGSGSSGNGDGGGDNGDSGGGSTIDASNFDINSCGVDIPFGLDIAIKKAIENVDISGKTNEEITKRFCEIIKDLVKNSNKNSGIPKP